MEQVFPQLQQNLIERGYERKVLDTQSIEYHKWVVARHTAKVVISFSQGPRAPLGRALTVVITATLHIQNHKLEIFKWRRNDTSFLIYEVKREDRTGLSKYREMFEAKSIDDWDAHKPTYMYGFSLRLADQFIPPTPGDDVIWLKWQDSMQLLEDVIDLIPIDEFEMRILKLFPAFRPFIIPDTPRQQQKRSKPSGFQANIAGGLQHYHDELKLLADTYQLQARGSNSDVWERRYAPDVRIRMNFTSPQHQLLIGQIELQHSWFRVFEINLEELEMYVLQNPQRALSEGNRSATTLTYLISPLDLKVGQLALAVDAFLQLLDELASSRPCTVCAIATLGVCSRCQAPYCSVECQRTDWEDGRHAEKCSD